MSDMDFGREKRPSALKGLLFFLVLSIVAGGLVYAALNLRSSEGPNVAQDTPRALSVAVVEARISDAFEMKESFTGLATPKRTSQLGFTTGGRIARLQADTGDRVGAGAVLAVLDTRNLRAQLAASEAGMEEARAARELAMKSVQRQRELRDRGHVSQQLVDEASAAALQADARLIAAGAQADTLRVQIDLSQIVAPYGGVITQRFADEGTIASPGQPIFELVESSALEARIGLPAAVSATLEPGRDYLLSADTGQFNAKLRTVTGVIDARQRTVAAVFDIDPRANVPVGSVVRLAIDRQLQERGSWVPVAALTESGRGLWAVMIADRVENGWVAQARLVEIIHNDGERAFVRGLIAEGDRVIVDGLERITPGQPVAPRMVDLAESLAPASAPVQP